ncbi:hypothetical protein AAC387_Pa04g1096 [Persea americana]
MVRCLFFILLLLHGVVGQKFIQKWSTFSGEAPLIVARGGYSGLFPESSEYAYQFATATGISGGVGLFCDLQLTKDGAGICRADLRLDNSTNIGDIFPKGKKSYPVNGKPVSGWFSVDFTVDQMFSNVTIIQNIFSRPSIFDASLPMMTIDDLVGLKPPKLWLNVQYDMFFKEHKLDIGAFVLDASTHMRINYISSPEIGFLKGLNEKLRKGKTKLIFRFLEADSTEPSTKQKYSSILENLSSIKAFASGILVPKEYIWPVSKEGYLQPHTNLVADAHKQGLEVFASGFANDNPGSYNYSYDPSAEYLQFIDNPDFSVDGVLTDFPSTASAALACFAQNKNSTVPTKGKPLIITHNGASGVYPGCTDLAYQQAVDDGADIIDCSVQMSKDGVAFCLNSADLMGDTTVMTAFISRSTTVPEIQQKSGIFSFDLTWSEIQGLKPEMTSPVAQADLKRNPAYKNQGKFFTLSNFLDFAKRKSVAGILINIQNAAYLASNKGLDITDAVISALSKTGYEKETTQQVLIQSDDTSVLSAFQKFSNYKRVLMVPEVIGDAPKPAVEEIKHFANAVTLSRGSIVITENGFITGFTDVVEKMHAANISVYVSTLINEYLAIAFDYFSDPMVEISTYTNALTVDGIMTEFPATATKFMRSPCFHPADDAPYSILPAQAGSLVSLVPPELLPPSEPPAPALTVANIVDPPLPSVKKVAPAPGEAGTSSGRATVTINMSLCLVMLVFSFMSLSYH